MEWRVMQMHDHVQVQRVDEESGRVTIVANFVSADAMAGANEYVDWQKSKEPPAKAHKTETPSWFQQGNPPVHEQEKLAVYEVPPPPPPMESPKPEPPVVSKAEAKAEAAPVGTVKKEK